MEKAVNILLNHKNKNKCKQRNKKVIIDDDCQHVKYHSNYTRIKIVTVHLKLKKKYYIVIIIML